MKIDLIHNLLGKKYYVQNWKIVPTIFFSKVFDSVSFISLGVDRWLDVIMLACLIKSILTFLYYMVALY